MNIHKISISKNLVYVLDIKDVIYIKKIVSALKVPSIYSKNEKNNMYFIHIIYCYENSTHEVLLE